MSFLCEFFIRAQSVWAPGVDLLARQPARLGELALIGEQRSVAMLGTRAPGATHLALVAMALWRLLDAIDGWRQQSLHGSHDAIDALIT